MNCHKVSVDERSQYVYTNIAIGACITAQLPDPGKMLSDQLLHRENKTMSQWVEDAQITLAGRGNIYTIWGSLSSRIMEVDFGLGLVIGIL